MPILRPIDHLHGYAYGVDLIVVSSIRKTRTGNVSKRKLDGSNELVLTLRGAAGLAHAGVRASGMRFPPHSRLQQWGT